MSRILVWKSKHSDYYYDASTDEKLANAALDILRDWLRDGYIPEPEDPYDPELIAQKWHEDERRQLELADKELESGDSEATREWNAKVSKAKAKVASKRKRYTDDLADYARVQKLVEDWDTTIVQPEAYVSERTGEMRTRRGYIKAWHVLQGYAGGEYQDVFLEDLIVANQESEGY